MKPEAKKKMGRGQEQFQPRRKDLWTETAVVYLSSSLAPPTVYKVQEQFPDRHMDLLTGMETTSGAALMKTTILTGLAMDSVVGSRLTVRC